MVYLGVNIRKKLEVTSKQASSIFTTVKNHWNDFTDKQKNIILALGVSIFAIIVWLQYGLFEFPLTNDMGIYLYGGKELLGGNIPYVSVFDVKPPMTFIVSAVGLFIFHNTLGLSPILVSRIVMLLFGSGTVFFTYLLAFHIFKDRIHAILSSIILISFTGFGWAALSGRPKILMVFFSVACLYALIRKKWCIAGILGSLSALTWQPGAILPLVVILYSLMDKQERKKQLIRSIIGAALPLVIVVAFFFIMGGLQEMINQTVLFTVTFKKATHWGFDSATNILIYSLVYHYGTEILFFIAGFIGFIIFTFKKRKTLMDLKNPLPFIFLSFIPLMLYSLYDFQGLFDAVPLLPFVALFASYFLLKFGKKISGLLQHRTKLFHKKTITYVAAIIIILSSFYGILPILGESEPVMKNIIDEFSSKEKSDQINKIIINEGLLPAIPLIVEDVGILRIIKLLFFTTKNPGKTYQEQIDLAAQIDANSNPDERLLFIANPDILCLSHRKNFDRYILYPADILYMNGTGELTSYREKVISEQPSLIVVNRKQNSDNNSVNITGLNIPQELGLTEFIIEEYEKIWQTANHVLFKKK